MRFRSAGPWVKWGAPVALVFALWLTNNLFALDVRAGLGAGSVEGFITLIHRGMPTADPRLHLPPDSIWQLQVDERRGGRPRSFYNFPPNLPSRLKLQLERRGVAEQRHSEDGLFGPPVMRRWSDTNRLYRVSYAGIGRRVVTAVEPLP